MKITKRSHPEINHLKQVRNGDQPELIFCEGARVIEEAIKSHLPIKAFFCTSEMEPLVQSTRKKLKNQNPSINVLSSQVMEYVSSVKTPPGWIAIVERPKTKRPEIPTEPKVILVLHGLQDPTNVGAIIRTAEGGGAHAVWLTGASADPFGARAIRASSGSVFRVPIIGFKTLEDALSNLSSKKIKKVALTQHGETAYTSINWNTPAAIFLGGEGAGFKPQELAQMDDRIEIPMSGKLESLNVATAAAICLFEAKRQQTEH